ncbi:MAG: FAD-binding oxidoreductase, partial [Spirochaetota bacterium]
PLEGTVNPFRLTIGFAEKAKVLGAELYTHTEVTGMEISRGEVKAIVTEENTFISDLVIVAAGAWTREVVKLAGIELPVFYERGEAMVSVPVSPLIRGMITDGGLFLKNQPNHAMVVGSCLAQTLWGNIILAQATTDVDNYDCSSTYEGPVKVARRVLFFFPGLHNVEILRMWGGVVAYTGDRAPIFGFLENPRNLFVVVGFHSAIGIASALGSMVGDIYRGGSISHDFTHYSPKRFSSVKRR